MRFSVVTAVVWDREGRPRALPTLEGDVTTQAFGINPFGRVVGISVDKSGGIAAVMWR